MVPKHLLLCCFILTCGLQATAQNKIALEHNGFSSFFNDISSAISAAEGGDTIYLPGGSFPGFDIDKKLAIIGAGHNPSNTSATTMTLITGDISMTSTDCDGSLFTGLRITGTIYGYSYDIDYVQILRCFVSQIYGVYSGYDNWTISECFVNQIILVNSSISNCLIIGYISGSNLIIGNNVFTSDSYSTADINGTSNTIKNNIFKFISEYFYVSGNNAFSLFYNNIYSEGIVLPIGMFGNGIIGTGNIHDIDFDALFTNFSYATYAGNPNSLYQFDFHLTNTAYNIGGTDGAPIGIYGGLFPWKEGSVPFNPHIESKQISSTTDPTGNLNVNIQVEAQDN